MTKSNWALTGEEDGEDLRLLFRKVLSQAVDDYIRLQHPATRKKKYLQEDFLNAVDMFFDDEYRMLHIPNENGEPTSLKDFIKTMLESESADVENIKRHVVAESLKFWADKNIRVIEIPDELIIEGHVYTVLHSEEVELQIGFDEKTIILNKDADDSANQERFVYALNSLLCHHNDIKLPQKVIKELSKSWFRTLKMNNCFFPA